MKKLTMSTKVHLVIKDGTETLVDAKIVSKRLKKKEQRAISEIVAKAQAEVEDNPLEALDEIEEAAKLRFSMQIDGDEKSMEQLTEFAEDYGYTLVVQEIDDRVEEANERGK